MSPAQKLPSYRDDFITNLNKHFHVKPTRHKADNKTIYRETEEILNAIQTPAFTYLYQ